MIPSHRSAGSSRSSTSSTSSLQCNRNSSHHRSASSVFKQPFSPSSSSANPTASFMPPNPLQTYFCQDIQPGISLLNSTINSSFTVELHTRSCALPFKSQFRKWSCSLDDVFLCQCLVACNFFPSSTSKSLWQKPIDGNAPGILRQVPQHQLQGCYRQLMQKFPFSLPGRS